MLAPLLRADLAPTPGESREWTKRLVADCKDLLSSILPLGSEERKFLDLLNERGEIVPDLLTDDPRLQDIVRTHPGLLWKALNARGHRGFDEPNPPAL